MSDNKRITETISLVPDTSILIEGYLSRAIKDGTYKKPNIIITNASISELESKANKNMEIGYQGIKEIEELNRLYKNNKIQNFETKGIRPNLEQIKLARSGEIDAIIRDTATETRSTLVTMDKVQYNVAKAIGTNAELIKPTITPENELTTSIDDFFTLKDNVMSVHLKEGEPPTGKYGSIEDIQYTEIHHKPCTSEDIHKIKNELYHLTRVDPDSRIEMSSNGATVFQIRDMRIAATTPPFSNKMEITAVRPVINIDFEKYRVPHDIKSRIHKKRGILIAGAPGAGKSTFAAGMATYISLFGNVVKTMENPRDLQVPNNITQYGPLDEEMANTAEMLLLVRPDFTLYDEVRKTKDFEVFADMRLAGIGMIGVVHANKAVDAVQRMITRTDIGLIPQIVDTIIFIDKGNIETIYTLELTVKIPHGMASEDLARPVVKVINYSNNKTEFEIYTFGEQTIVMPITNVNPEGTDENIPPECRTPEEKINKVINEYVNNPFEIEIVKNNQIVLYAHPKDVTALIGKGGKRIRNIERKLNLKITVKRQGNK